MSRFFFNLVLVVFFVTSAIIAQATVPTFSLAESAKEINLTSEIDQAQEDVEFVSELRKVIIRFNSGKQLYKGIVASLEAQARYVNENEVPCVLIEINHVSAKLWNEVETLVRKKGIVSMEVVYWTGEDGQEKVGYYFTFIGFDDKIYP